MPLSSACMDKLSLRCFNFRPFVPVVLCRLLSAVFHLVFGLKVDFWVFGSC